MLTETSDVHEVKNNSTWRSIAFGLIALVFMALAQYAALGFTTPSRREVSDQVAQAKAESTEKIKALESKIDQIQNDVEQLKIQAERTNTLMEMYIRSAQRTNK